MALNNEGVISVIFYFLFSIVIAIVLIMVKQGSENLTGKDAQWKREGHHVKTPNDEETMDLRSPETVFLSTGHELAESLAGNKQRNRHKWFRERPHDKDKRENMRQRMSLSPSCRSVESEYQSVASSEASHWNMSSPSRYFSNTKSRETEGCGETTSTSEGNKSVEHVISAVACVGNIVSFRSQSDEDQIFVDHTETCEAAEIFENKCIGSDPLDAATEERHGLLADSQDITDLSSTCRLQRGFEGRNRSRRASSIEEEETQILEFHDRSSGVQENVGRIPDISSNVSMELSRDAVDHFHLVRPALATTIAPSGVCVDSFTQLNICPPPQDKKHGYRLKQENPPRIGTGKVTEVNRSVQPEENCHTKLLDSEANSSDIHCVSPDSASFITWITFPSLSQTELKSSRSILSKNPGHKNDEGHQRSW